MNDPIITRLARWAADLNASVSDDDPRIGRAARLAEPFAVAGVEGSWHTPDELAATGVRLFEDSCRLGTLTVARRVNRVVLELTEVSW